MRAELSSIKLGSRVVYVVGGVEYNALALGTASEGWSQGIRLGTISLSLIYLNELGVPVKIIAAPLLGVAADDQHLAGIAQDAAEKTFGYLSAGRDEKTQMVADQLKNIKANPRTNGWRPYVEGEDMTALRAQLAQANEVIGQLNYALSQTQLPPEQAPKEAKELPSAEDLDHVAAEAEAAAATAGSLADATGDSGADDDDAPGATGPAPVMPVDPTDFESVLAAQAAGSALLDPSSASSSTPEADASLSPDQPGTEADVETTSASTETEPGPTGPDPENPEPAGAEPTEEAGQSQPAAAGE